MKKLKVFAALSAVIMCMMLVVPCFGATVIADKVGEEGSETTPVPQGSPEFAIKLQQYYTVNAGETTKIPVKLENMTEWSCKIMNATIKDPKDVFKFESTTLICERSIPYNSARTIYFDLAVPKTLKAGRYPIDIELQNINWDYVASTQTLTIYIDVVNDFDAEGVTVSDYKIDKEQIKSGDSFNISATIKNNSGADINNIKAELEGLDGTKFAMNEGLSYTTFNLKKDEEKVITFPIIACSGITSIREVIPLNISYYVNPDNKDSQEKSTTNITVPCKTTTSSEGKGFAPSLIIESYDFGGDYVLAGKAFPLNIKIKNTSSTAMVENLKVTVQGGSLNKDKGAAFSPANSSNSFFFSKLGAASSTDIAIDILPRADANPDSYPIEVIFDYEYTSDGKKDKADSVTETITIPVQQDDRFAVNSIDIQPDAYIGQDCSVNASLVNKGKSSVYNVSVDIEGEGFDTTSTTYYIGNVESGTEEYYDTSIIPNTTGEIKGNLIISYEDANGNEKKITKEFLTNVSDMSSDEGMGDYPAGDMPGGDMPVDGNVSGGVSIWIIIVVAAAVLVVAAVVVIIVVVKNKKKKALLKETEDEDENI